MRTIIAGSRSVIDYALVKRVIESAPWKVTGVVSGGASGVDRLGERWAKENKLPLIIEPARWSVFGRSAGMMRNSQMARISEALIAIWDGQSPGTLNMISQMRVKHARVLVHNTRTGDTRMSQEGVGGWQNLAIQP